MGLSKSHYFLAFQLPEPVLGKVEEFKKTIATHFGSKAVLKAPAHITIVPPFQYYNDQSVINTLSMIPDFKKFPVKVNGFGSFGKKVLYLKPIIENDFFDYYQKVFDIFHTHLQIQKRKKPENIFIPHITIGNRDWSEDQFDKALAYFSKHDFHAAFTLQQMVLYKLEVGKWKNIAEKRSIDYVSSDI